MIIEHQVRTNEDPRKAVARTNRNGEGSKFCSSVPEVLGFTVVHIFCEHPNLRAQYKHDYSNALHRKHICTHATLSYSLAFGFSQTTTTGSWIYEEVLPLVATLG